MVSRLHHSLSQLILNVIHLLSLMHTLVVRYSAIGVRNIEILGYAASDDSPHFNCRV